MHLMWVVCLLWPFLGVTEVFVEVKNPLNHPTVDGSEIPNNHRLDGAKTL